MEKWKPISNEEVLLGFHKVISCFDLITAKIEELEKWKTTLSMTQLIMKIKNLSH